MAEAGEGALRPELVATAVRFLANPRVAATPPSQQREFLAKKGLSPPLPFFVGK